MLTFLFLGCTVLHALFLVACEGEPVVPGHLLGIWKTSEPRFAGCLMEFHRHELILGLKTGEMTHHAVKKIETLQEGGRHFLHTVYYADAEGQKLRLNLLYDPSCGGTLKLKNRPEIWKRAD